LEHAKVVAEAQAAAAGLRNRANWPS
jgi:hypothetical protein